MDKYQINRKEEKWNKFKLKTRNEIKLMVIPMINY